MKLIEYCFCCNLLTATSITGIYGLVAYVIAIVLEVWWMVVDEEEVPAGAYLLSFGHFILLILSGLLLLGAATKESKWLLYWCGAVGTWWIPEAALAIYMSLHHWRLDTPQGKTELVLWAVRAVCNLAGLLCVASLFSQWREEKGVLRRLQDLNLQAAMMMEGDGRQPFKNGHHNAGFQGSTPDVRSIENKVPLAAVETLVANKTRRNSTTSNGRGTTSRPAPSVQFISSYEKIARGLSNNEFSATTFLQHQAKTGPNNAALQRARSLLELQIQKHDHWRGPVAFNAAPRPLTPGYVDLVPEMYTQSLDRRRLGPRRPQGAQFGTLPRNHRPVGAPAPGLSVLNSNNSSKTSLASQHSEQKYRDIAL